MWRSPLFYGFKVFSPGYPSSPLEGCRSVRIQGDLPCKFVYINPMRLRAKGMTQAGACCFDNRSRM